MEVYAGLEPPEVWRHFGELNRIPRPSGREAAARAYVLRVAEAAGAPWARDLRGNVVVQVPARGGEGPPVAVQAHLDMVCEKRPEVPHDFDRDPILPRVQGEWVCATGTTLGADNGIGAAMALALLTRPDLRHGPLDLLFTVEEETGLQGAAALDPALVRARMLINLDSEDPRELTIGCAGGAGAVIRLPVQRKAAGGLRCVELVVAGLRGGHSGVQIHERRANAIRLLVRALRLAAERGVPLRLAALQGGNAHNAIPRDASARLALRDEEVEALRRAVEEARAAFRAEWAADEPGLSLEVRDAPPCPQVLTPDARDRLLGLLEALPHGVLAMSQRFPGKVETSSNLAQVGTEEASVEIATSSRSFVTRELLRVQERIRSLAEAAGAEVHLRDGYPGWEPDPDSRLLRLAREVYGRLFGEAPEVQVIHAGLECGVIVSRIPGMEAISFGPRIEDAHTPEERVHIPSVARTWSLLTALLERLSLPPAGD